jgi:hypothetical protein
VNRETHNRRIVKDPLDTVRRVLNLLRRMQAAQQAERRAERRSMPLLVAQCAAAESALYALSSRKRAAQCDQWVSAHGDNTMRVVAGHFERPYLRTLLLEACDRALARKVASL